MTRLRGLPVFKRPAPSGTGPDHGPPEASGVYEIDDLAALDAAELAALLVRAEAEATADQRTCAHLVVTCDLRTGLVRHHVPCSTGVEAIALAVRIVSAERAYDPPRPFTVRVTPLLPH